MRATLAFIAASLVAAQLSLPSAVAADDSVSRDTVVAVVNGQEITLGHVIIAYAGLPQEYQNMDPRALMDGIVEQLIQQTALSQTQTGDLPAHVKMSLDNERRSLLAAEEVERVMSSALTDDALKAQYDMDYANLDGGEEYHAAHILVETEEDAKAIKKELDEGADFAEMAKERSTGPSGPNGGDLGWFGAGRMVPDFEAAVVALEPGEISVPIQTQFGWHVILLKETRPLEAPDFEAVRGQLEQKVLRSSVETRINELTSEAEIQRPDLSGIPAEAIRDFSIVRN